MAFDVSLHFDFFRRSKTHAVRARHTAYRPRQGNRCRPVAQDIVLLRRLLAAKT